MSDKEFQSTLPRGERRYRHYMQRGDIIFQSTLPRGERHSVIYPKLPYITISIHAPARGATWSNFFQMFTYKLFQSTLPRGERHKICRQILFFGLFQSTLPRGERLFEISGEHKTVFISIHAPARGATQMKILWQSAL